MKLETGDTRNHRYTGEAQLHPISTIPLFFFANDSAHLRNSTALKMASRDGLCRNITPFECATTVGIPTVNGK
jgi:hypothetical protein